MKIQNGAVLVVFVQENDLPYGLYDPSGAIRVCPVPPHSLKGAYAPNGSLYSNADFDATYKGAYDGDGAIWIQSDGENGGWYRATGGMRITS